MTDATDTYREKRDFRKTGEPSGDAAADLPESPIWVVQEHDASSHHFDVRLRNPVSTEPEAVKSGRTVDEVAAEAEAGAGSGDE